MTEPENQLDGLLAQASTPTTVSVEESVEILEERVEELEDGWNVDIFVALIALAGVLVSVVVSALVAFFGNRSARETAQQALIDGRRARSEASAEAERVRRQLREWEDVDNAGNKRTRRQLEDMVKTFADPEEETWEVRRFETLQKRIGGFSPKELRQMLVTVEATRLWAAEDMGKYIKKGDELWSMNRELLKNPEYQGEPKSGYLPEVGPPEIEESPEIEEPAEAGPAEAGPPEAGPPEAGPPEQVELPQVPSIEYPQIR